MRNALLGMVFVTLFFVTPAITFGAGLVPCGGEGEPVCQSCHVVTLVNGVVEWLILILGTVAAILIVVAGIKLVTSGGNTQAKEKAKSMITNLFIGYIIVLGGWLMIDYIMKALLIENGTEQFGVWNQVSCTDQKVATEKDPLKLSFTGGVENLPCTPLPNGGTTCNSAESACSANGGTPSVDTSVNPNVVRCNYPAGSRSPQALSTGGILPQCNSSNSACSVSALIAGGLSPQQANIMSCIAITESSGNPSTPPHNVTNPGSPSSACGTFQVTRTTWATAATGACSSFSNCQNAACNLQTAVTLVRRGGYSDWTCKGCNNKASKCIGKYSG